MNKRNVPRRSRKQLRYSLLAVTAVCSIWYVLALPRPLFDVPYSPVLEDARGQLLEARIAQDGQWRFPLPDSLPDKYTTAVITFEDKRFFRHPGVDLRALLRALRQNLRAGRVVSGGSTISMQVIRLASDNPPRTLAQKGREIILATRLEWSYSKQDILRLYAGHAPFGGNIVGIDAATWRYFGKSPNLLSWSEACLLAVLPNSPAMMHPGKSRESLKAKRDRLLYRLFERGQIDSLSYVLAQEEPLPPAPRALPNKAPHLMDRVIRDYANGQLPSPRVSSSLDASLQQSVTAIINRHQRQLASNQIHNVAALVMHIPTGTYRAYVGNAPNCGPSHSPAVDIIRSPRSTGSILKPFLYATALQEGKLLSKSLLPDYPTNYQGYSPENYAREYTGATAADRALIRSLNVPFVHLLEDYGVPRFQFALQKTGLTTLTYPPDHYGLTLILGGAEARLDELTAAYAKMSYTLSAYLRSNGQYPVASSTALPYLAATDRYLEYKRGQKQEWAQQPEGLRAGAIWKTFQAMRQLERPAGRHQWEYVRPGRQIAWKTGTSFGFRDAWAIGVTPEYAVGVWVGNASGEGRPGLIGVKTAGPILFDIFEQLPATSWWERPLDDLDRKVVCATSGDLAGPHCPAGSSWEVRSPIGGQPCTHHQLIHLDPSEKYRADHTCFNPQQLVAAPWFVLPPRSAYYYRRDHPAYRPLPPFYPGCGRVDESQQVMQLIYPQQPRRIFIPQVGKGRRSKTVFELAHQRPEAVVYWHLDERFIGRTRHFHSMQLDPNPGTHRLVLVDERGNRLEQTFDIIAEQ